MAVVCIHIHFKIHCSYPQLNPIERYAMRFVEETGGLWIAEQLRIAEAEIEQQKRNWEADRLAALQKEQEEEQQRDEEELLTYSRSDAKNQVNNRSKYVNRRLKRGQPPHERPQIQTPSRGGPKRAGNLSSSATSASSPAPRVKTNISSSLGGAVAFRKRQQPQPRSPTPPQPRRIVPKRSSNAQTAPTPDKRTKIMPSPVSNAKKRTLSAAASGAKTPTNTMRATKVSSSRRTKARDDDEDDTTETEQDSSSESRSVTSAENGSDEINHDEDDDSECSLDAMYDSIDDDQSDDDQRSSISESNAGEEDEEEDDNDGDDDDEIVGVVRQSDDGNSEEDADSDEESVLATIRDNPKRNLVQPTVVELNGTTSPMSLSTGATRQRSNHVDINSPRTRSRGTVQLDLWTLDDSPICPDIKTSKRRSMKTSTVFASGNAAASSAVVHVLDSDESDAAATKTTGNFVEPADRECKRNGGGARVRNVTLEKWISKSPRTMRSLSPMVILCKEDVSRMMHSRGTATRTDGGGGGGGESGGGESIGRRTRGSSVAKTTAGTQENGMT